MNRLGVGDIDGDHGNTLADLGGQLPGRFMIKIGNNDRRSRSRESADGLFADPAGAARHQSPAAIESKRLFHAVVGAMKPPLSPAQSWAAHDLLGRKHMVGDVEEPMQSGWIVAPFVGLLERA